MRAVYFEHKCSHCGQSDRLAFEVGLQIDEADPYQDWFATLDGDTQNLVREMENSGLVSAYERSAKEILKVPPRNPAKGLLNYMRHAAREKLSPAVELALVQQFGRDRRIEVLQHCGIAAIVVDGQLAMFAPKTLLYSEELMKMQSSPLTSVAKLAKVSESMGDWVRTRMGYVPHGAALFFEEMRRKHFGDWDRRPARPSQKAARS